MYRFKNIFRIPKKITIISAIFYCVLFMVASSYIYKRVAFKKNINSSNILQIAKLNESQGNKNNFYTNIDYLHIESNKSNKNMLATKYMTLNDNEYEDIYFIGKYKKTLNENEVIISNNLSKEYNLKIDDKLFVYIDTKVFEYKIVHISNNFYGDINIDYNSNGIFILGYNEELYELVKNNIKIIKYSNEPVFNFNEHVLKYDLIKNANKDIYNIVSILILIHILIYIIIELLWSNKTNLNVDIMYKKDVPLFKVFIYLLINSIYKYILILLAPIILILFSSIFLNLNIVYIVLSIFLIIVVTILIDLIRFSFKVNR